jgi:hypothetical protein
VIVLRRLLSLLAIVSVLLHAGAAMRHHGLMLGAHLQHQALLADLHSICASGVAGTPDADDLPQIPRPSDARAGCPICSGLAPLFAVTPPAPRLLALIGASPDQPPFLAAALVPQTRNARPPARGPPATA